MLLLLGEEMAAVASFGSLSAELFRNEVENGVCLDLTIRDFAQGVSQFSAFESVFIV